MQSKNILQSKTFWLNILSVGALIVPGLPLDAQTIGLIAAGLNVGVRVLTSGPVHVLKDAATEP